MTASARGSRFLAVVISGVLLFVLLACIAGCSQDLPPEEYGIVIYEVPSLPEAQKPYEMPKLGPPLTEEQKRELQSMRFH